MMVFPTRDIMLTLRCHDMPGTLLWQDFLQDGIKALKARSFTIYTGRHKKHQL